MPIFPGKSDLCPRPAFAGGVVTFAPLGRLIVSAENDVIPAGLGLLVHAD